MQPFFRSLVNPKLAPTAAKVALVVGSILFVINHGSALAKGDMDRSRWLSAGLTYFVPYMVNIHGQHSSRQRQQSS